MTTLIAYGMLTLGVLSASTEPVELAIPPGLLPPGMMPPGAPGGDTKDFPKFEDVTKDMKTIEGFFTLYRDEKKDRLLARVPRAMLNKHFLLATSIAKGPFFAGWQWMDGPVYWDRMDKKLVLMAADPRYARAKGSTVEDVVARTYTDSIIRAIPIVTEADGDAVVDLADVLKSDFLSLKEVFDARVDRGLSRFAKVKNFEKNTEIAVDFTLMDKNPLQGGMSVQVHYSLSKLPENDYKPRVADPRVGYFLVAVKDWAADHRDPTIFRRYINRWQLRKAEPDKEVSDVLPEDQIVFYIEKTVPVKFRQYVRDGILEWNKAFEAAGLRNAIVVHQQTDKNEYADIDPEDVRYNFFRWIVTGQGFAMGPSRVNPFTGQILDADIIFDDSMVRYVIKEYDLMGPRPPAGISDGPIDELLAGHPEWDWSAPESAKPAGPMPASVFELQSSNFGPRHREGSLPHADCKCELGTGMTRQLTLASYMAAAAGERKLSEEFIGQAIKETVMHEVGHTLGMRHNFKASSWLKMSDIRARKPDDGQATTASVMDYNPYTFSQSVSEQGSFASPTLGPYDYWVIEYGYKPYTPGKDDKPSAKEGTTPPPTAELGATDGVDPKDGDKPKGDDKPKVDEKPKGDEMPKPAEKAEPDVKKLMEKAMAAAGGKMPPGAGKAGGDAKPLAGEEKMLKAIASRCAEPGLAYATDEDTSSIFPDPLVNRFDNGSDPLEFARERMAVIEKLWKDGLDWAVKDGESMHRARRAFDMLLGEYGYVAPFAARFVGGQYINRDHKGDQNARAPRQVVPVDKQREALKFVTDTVLSDSAFHFSPALLNSLAPGRWGHWDTEMEGTFDRIETYPIHGRVLSIQARVLFQLINPFNLNRVYDAQMQVPTDQEVLGLSELQNSVLAAVWSEVTQTGGTDRNTSTRQPLVSSFRRSLQRYHLQALMNIVLDKPGSQVYADVHSVVRWTLKDLNARIEKALAAKGARLDDFTRAHWVDSSTRIKRALEAEFVANPKPVVSGPVIRFGQNATPTTAP